MKLEKWRDGFQIVVSEESFKKWMTKCGAFTEFEKAKKQAEKEGMPLQRILFPKITGFSIFGIPLIEKSS